MANGRIAVRPVLLANLALLPGKGPGDVWERTDRIRSPLPTPSRYNELDVNMFAGLLVNLRAADDTFLR